MKLVPYLVFQGNCKEAMEFYKSCLEGELTIDTVENSPMESQMPPEMKNFVLNSQLDCKDFVIMASDAMGQETKTGDNISIMIMGSETEVETFFNNLKEGATIIQPLEKQFWGSVYGALIDKFGISWSFNSMN